MQFMSSSLEKLVKDLANNDFRYLIEKCGSKNLEHLKEKDTYPYECVDRFERFSEEKLPNKRCFYRSLKDGTTGDNGKKLNGHISDEEYLICNKIWNKFNMKIRVITMIIIFKNNLLLADIVVIMFSY